MHSRFTHSSLPIFCILKKELTILKASEKGICLLSCTKKGSFIRIRIKIKSFRLLIRFIQQFPLCVRRILHFYNLRYISKEAKHLTECQQIEIQQKMLFGNMSTSKHCCSSLSESPNGLHYDIEQRWISAFFMKIFEKGQQKLNNFRQRN